jgi:hypothetical protein
MTGELSCVIYHPYCFCTNALKHKIFTTNHARTWCAAGDRQQFITDFRSGSENLVILDRAVDQVERFQVVHGLALWCLAQRTDLHFSSRSGLFASANDLLIRAGPIGRAGPQGWRYLVDNPPHIARPRGQRLNRQKSIIGARCLAKCVHGCVHGGFCRLCGIIKSGLKLSPGVRSARTLGR